MTFLEIVEMAYLTASMKLVSMLAKGQLDAGIDMYGPGFIEEYRTYLFADCLHFVLDELNSGLPANLELTD